MEQTLGPLTENEIKTAFEGANFGEVRSLKKLLEQGVLKKLCGYSCGHTLTCIMGELSLIGKKGILQRGRKLIFEAFYDRKNSG